MPFNDAVLQIEGKRVKGALAVTSKCFTSAKLIIGDFKEYYSWRYYRGELDGRHVHYLHLHHLLGHRTIATFSRLTACKFYFRSKDTLHYGSGARRNCRALLLLSTFEIIPFTLDIILGLTIFVAAAFCLVSLRLFS